MHQSEFCRYFYGGILNGKFELFWNWYELARVLILIEK